MELNSIDYLLYKYPDNPITKFMVWLIFLRYGDFRNWERDNLHISWSTDFSVWHVVLILDGYDDELIASLTYISADNENQLRFKVVDERILGFWEFIDVPLDAVKVTNVPA